MRGGSVVKGPRTTLGWSEPVIVFIISFAIFSETRIEANIIMRRHEVYTVSAFKRP